jgi:hypothetical protein
LGAASFSTDSAGDFSGAFACVSDALSAGSGSILSFQRQARQKRQSSSK